MLGLGIKAVNEKNTPKDKTPDNLNENEKNSYKGIDGDPLTEKVSKMKTPPSGEILFEGTRASGLRIGGDRINEKPVPGGGLDEAGNPMGFQYGGGLAGSGIQNCGAVDIFAGLNSWDSVIGKVPDQPVNPNAEKDAARIYISAASNPDYNFDIPEGKIGRPIGKSTAVMKSDHTRIIGREGLKICAGIDRYNSKGKKAGKILSVPPVEIFSGQIDKDQLEPVPKGYKLVKALDEIMNRMGEISSALQNFIIAQTEFNCVLLGHTHPDGVAISIGSLAGAGPKGFLNGEVLPSMKVALAGLKSALEGLAVNKDIAFHRIAIEGDRVAKLEPFSTDQINSRSVYIS